MSFAFSKMPCLPTFWRRIPFARVRVDRKGVTSLEWALISVTFFLLIISIFDLVRYVVTLQSVSAVMTEAGRACLVNRAADICYASDASSWATASVVAPTLDPSQLTIHVLMDNYVVGASSVPGTHCIQVTVSYPYSATAPWMSSLGSTVSETATYIN